MHLGQEIFEWFCRSHPTEAIPHQVRPSDFPLKVPFISSGCGPMLGPLPGPRRKLALVLDLDMTLVHALQFSAFTPKFDPSSLYSVKFSSDVDNPQIFSLMLDDQPYILKLRPGVRAFLNELAPLYELSIFTKATRPYLNFLLAALDPDRELFACAISRDDAPELDIDTKVMSLVTDRPLSEIVVFDDRQTVWRECAENVVRADPYVFLEKKMGSLAAAVNNKTCICEDPDRQLASISELLKSIHFEYSQSTDNADVREIIKRVRSRVLKGCRLMFSGVLKEDMPELLKQVSSLGGEVSLDEDDLYGPDGQPRVTHLVVAGNVRTKKIYDASKHNGKIKIVHAGWLAHAGSVWRRPREDWFDLTRFGCDSEGRVLEVDPWEVERACRSL